MFLAFALDALAIAAQTITGTALGAGDLAGHPPDHRPDHPASGSSPESPPGSCSRSSPRCSARCSPTTPRWSTLLGRVLLVAALFQPVAGVVFVLDGVLIGAGDGRYLAIGGIAVTAAFVPVAAGHRRSSCPPERLALVWLWVAFGAVFLGGRAAGARDPGARRPLDGRRARRRPCRGH